MICCVETFEHSDQHKMNLETLNTKKQNKESYSIFFKTNCFILIPLFLLSLLFSSCQSNKSDPSKITMRPRIYMEKEAPIPIFDEYDLTSVQIGTVDNIFSDDPEDRIFALWFGFDRRSAMALQKETVRNIGKRLQLSIGGQLVGIHPIEKGISNGVLPFILSESITEENAAFLYQELKQSLLHIRAELLEQK